MTQDIEQLIRKSYAAFNARQIDEILLMMDPDIKWANGWEGGYVTGHDEVRNYWTRQWQTLNPTVEPVGFRETADKQLEVDVQQKVKDLKGNLLFDGKVKHLYTFKNGLITSMEIKQN
jgi:hypothetical protein